jgi:hypothetical protein
MRIKQLVWIAIGATGVLGALSVSALPPYKYAREGQGGGDAPEAKKTEVIVIAKEGEEAAGPREYAWLGVLAEEAPEALAAQLQLDPGVGLLVSYVAPEGPSAKAGLQKNDLLVQFNNQDLVHPAQLRKLVQARKEGDEVQLSYYRAGKKESMTVKLGKTKAMPFLGDEHSWQGDLKELQRQLGDLPIRENLQKQMIILKDTLGNLKIDQHKIQADVQRSLAEAQKAVQEAMQQAGGARVELNNAEKKLSDLRRAKAQAKSVIVRSGGHNVRSMVKSDDQGTVVLVCDPKARVTVHDKEGKLLFDGPISTVEEKGKVPKEVLERIEPMLKEVEEAPAEPEEPAESEKE